MVSSGTVQGDLSSLMSYFSTYTNTMDSLDNPSVWEGSSKDNAMSQSEAFVSEYKEQLSSQMTTFAGALNDYETWKTKKSAYTTAYNNYQNAVNNNDTNSANYYSRECSNIKTEMTTLESKIKEALSTVSGQKLASATSIVETYPNLFTLNEFVFYSQGDYHQAYGQSGTIASSGCGPTSAAMVLTYLTGETHDPVEVANYSVKNGYRCEGNGTYEALFPAVAKTYGLNCKQEEQTTSNIIASLKAGNVIIAHMGPGHFTSGGHYIVLKGLDENGKVIVADPNGGKRNGSWDASVIASESKGSMYSFSA